MGRESPAGLDTISMGRGTPPRGHHLHGQGAPADEHHLHGQGDTSRWALSPWSGGHQRYWTPSPWAGGHQQVGNISMGRGSPAGLNTISMGRGITSRLCTISTCRGHQQGGHHLHGQGVSSRLGTISTGRVGTGEGGGTSEMDTVFKDRRAPARQLVYLEIHKVKSFCAFL